MDLRNRGVNPTSGAMRSMADELAAKPPEALTGWAYGTAGSILPQEPVGKNSFPGTSAGWMAAGGPTAYKSVCKPHLASPFGNRT
jgi:hypothetical protein